VLLRRARLLGDRPAHVNVIQRAERQSSLAASLLLRAHGLSPVWHLASRGRSLASLRADLARAADGGLDRVLCLRGDHAARDAPDTPKLRDLVGRVRAALPHAEVGVTLNPYLPAEHTLPNLWGKLAAGASFVQTQPVFAPEPFTTLAAQVKARAPEVRILPMVLPVLSLAQADRLTARLKVSIDPELRDRLARGGESEGWAALAATLGWLRTCPHVDGIAVMTFEADPSPRYVTLLERALEG
jgi:methylenetetrahydrofolate reductase (NADPH)